MFIPHPTTGGAHALTHTAFVPTHFEPPDGANPAETIPAITLVPTAPPQLNGANPTTTDSTHTVTNTFAGHFSTYTPSAFASGGSPHHRTINLGRHLLAEFYECDPNVLNNAGLIESTMVDAAKSCGATVITQNFHQFSPYGVSGVVIISESHLTIHTWPEFGYAAVDLFTCGDTCDPKVAYQYLKEHFNAGSAFYSELTRGLMNVDTREVMHSGFNIREEFAEEDGTLVAPVHGVPQSATVEG
ncbi:MAG: adenosylmethionine decarboxylase [Vampirovibrionales bacterium]|nr:adenosylmethionine decarboxylase [Vampirovibrionales bacterium]